MVSITHMAQEAAPEAAGQEPGPPADPDGVFTAPAAQLCLHYGDENPQALSSKPQDKAKPWQGDPGTQRLDPPPLTAHGLGTITLGQPNCYTP